MVSGFRFPVSGLVMHSAKWDTLHRFVSHQPETGNPKLNPRASPFLLLTTFLPPRHSVAGTIICRSRVGAGSGR